jgi:hypothetical protein
MKRFLLLLLVSQNALAFFGSAVPRNPPKAYFENEAKEWVEKGRCPIQMENKSRTICLKMLKEQREKTP